jgi:peptidyl-prolyl cis-trans isomerase A (cyclophilin A)
VKRFALIFFAFANIGFIASAQVPTRSAPTSTPSVAQTPSIPTTPEAVDPSQRPVEVVPLSPPPPGEQAIPTQTAPVVRQTPEPPPEQQPLAPGPGVSEQTAPVNTGNSNIPAPAAPVPDTATQTENPAPVYPEDKDPAKELKKRVFATFRTSMGNFKVRLFTRQAPRSTRMFIELAKGEKEFIDAKTGQKVRRPFYNGLIFHRVVKNFIIQGGCPFGNGTGGPGFTFADEFTPALRHKKAGIVSLANAGKDTNGSQFFITLSAQPDFDDKYTVIGEVVDGMNVVKDIGRLRVGPTDRPVKRVTIISVDISEQIKN